MFDNRQIVKLYTPIFIEQTLAAMVIIISTMMVSGVSAEAVSGVGLVDSINALIIYLFTAIATGVTVIVSQYTGAKNREMAGKAAGQALIVSMEASAVFGALLILFADPLLRALFGSADQAVLDEAYIYLIASSVSMPLQALYATSAGIMRAVGNSRTPMYASLFANIAYIGVSSLCIYVLGMGVLGAGLGIIASRLTSSGIVFFLLMKGNSQVTVPRLSFKPEWKILYPILRIALPAGADSLLFNGGKLIVQVFVSGMGTAAIAANSIGFSLSNLINLPGVSMSVLSMTVVGQCYGAGLIKDALRHMKRLTLIAMGLMAVTCFAMYLAFDPVISLFKPTAESLPLLRTILYMIFISTPILWPLAFTTPNMLRATGDVKFPMVVSISSMFVLRVVGAWFFGIKLGWGLPGIWFSMIADWMGRCVFFLPRMLSCVWDKGDYATEEKRADLIGHDV